jgi:hypothetical protein
MADLIERLTNPEATEQLIGMVSYEAATWRVEPNRERDAVEEAGFLDAVAHTLEALRTALSQEREARERAERERDIKAELLKEEFRESARRADKIMALKARLAEAEMLMKPFAGVLPKTSAHVAIDHFLAQETNHER